ncbi:SLC13 family permease [Salirhabdus salicampi]|uniref:SLC13 family permease n=1 Tax=Salirhabdus salicampi TaxID=476102 RepID=UPI0020C439EA|nr:SLC13 family permease [Salirhabdus salicampi]
MRSTYTKGIIFGSSIVIFLLLFLLTNNLSLPISLSISLIVASIPLWIFEPIPYAQTALLLLMLFMLFDIVEAEVILSGFSSLALFLVMAGLMIGKAVNETNLGKRLALWFLLRLMGLRNGVLIGIIIIQQVLSLFVPAPSIRTALLLPIVENLLEGLPRGSSGVKKQVMLGLAYAGNVSTICFLPSGIINVIAVEFINQYTSYTISYVMWFLLMMPIWLLMLPLIYFTITKVVHVEYYPKKFIQVQINRLKEEVPPINNEEKKAIIILFSVVLLWGTESLHGIHPAFSALLGVLFFSLPRVGIIKWDKIVKINMSLFFIVGATFSIGNILNQNGTADYVADLLLQSGLVNIADHDVLFLLFMIIIVHFYHIIITNIGTAAITLIPITLSMSSSLGVNPVYIVLITSVTLVFGFIFVIGTLPNILVQDTRVVHQRDFIVPGTILTIFSVGLTLVIALYWWPIFI